MACFEMQKVVELQMIKLLKCHRKDIKTTYLKHF